MSHDPSGLNYMNPLRGGKPPKEGQAWPIPPRGESQGVQEGATVENPCFKSRK